MFLYVTVVSVVLILVLKASTFVKKYLRNAKLLGRIPGPPEAPIIGHQTLLMQNPDFLFDRVREFSKRYYPIYRLWTPYVSIISLLEPNDIEIVLSSTKHLTKSKAYTFLYNWLGTGLLTSTGEKWHKRRKILTPGFHFNILQQFLNIFNEETCRLVSRLEGESGKVVDVVPPVTNFTLQSIAETAMAFGDVDPSAQKDYKNAVYEMGRIFFRRLSKPWFRLDFIYNLSQLAKEESAVIRILHSFSNKIIREREQKMIGVSSSKKKRLAMLDLLLAAKNEGADIDYEGIREEVDTFMFEGHDTTSMAVSFIFLVLANLEDVQDKVLEEILAVVGPTVVPTYSQLQELKYTERCIKETLRLFPSVPVISRYSSEEFTTKTGYRIPKDTVLHIQIFDLHRNENIYPDPLRFDPDRFLPERINERHPFSYVPFSAGPRNCIGQKFALLELKSVLCGVLRKFKLEKVDDMYEVEFRPDLVLRPKKEIKVKIVHR